MPFFWPIDPSTDQHFAFVRLSHLIRRLGAGGAVAAGRREGPKAAAAGGGTGLGRRAGLVWAYAANRARASCLTPRSPVALQCSTCSKCFLSRTELRLHEAFKHRGEKLFVCEECGHRASSRNGLQMHIKAKHRYDVTRVLPYVALALLAALPSPRARLGGAGERIWPEGGQHPLPGGAGLKLLPGIW